jgi:catechol 2,3-dioxygenase-like lactoylglutathione lyase family enzyme
MTAVSKIPSRLHHTAYVSRNLEATRKFYEDIIGLPLLATWCETDHLFGRDRTYCHLFFGLADGSALAFFQFANADDQKQFGPALASSPFRHIAINCDQETQDGIAKRLADAGYKEPDVYLLKHGYCTSLYAVDPDGMIMEFAVDNPEAAAVWPEMRAKAHSELKRWLAGDHTSNNMFRPHH